MGRRLADGARSAPAGGHLDPERQARARVWRYVFDCYEKKKAGVKTTGEEAKGKKDDRPKDSIR